MLALLSLSIQNNGLFQDKGKKKPKKPQTTKHPPLLPPKKNNTQPKQQQNIPECSQDANEQN